MKGGNPIDDLFARGLRDAEFTPPPAVWEGIVCERNWAHVTLLKLRRRWGYMLLALLLLGGGAAYFAAQEGAARNSTTTATVAAEESTSAVRAELLAATREAQNAAEVEEAQQAQVGTNPGEAHEYGNGQEPKGSEASLNMPSRADERRPIASTEAARNTTSRRASAPPSTLAADQQRANATSRAADANTTLTAGIADAGTSSTWNSNTHAKACLPAQVRDGAKPIPTMDADHANAPFAGAAFIGDARWMRTLPSVMAVTLRTDARPAGAHPEDPYVLRNKRIFFGLQLEWTSASGEWRGTGEEVAALNRSETWLDRKGIGAVGGLRWRSGLHLALAANASQQRSRFLRTMTIAGDTTTTVDTTWIATAAGPQTVYTWDIVPVTIAEPGIEERTTATNTYTQLRMAAELGYGHRLGRWSLGLRAGPMITATMTRKGKTLVPGPVQPDGDEQPPNPPMVMAVDDRYVDERFRLSVGAFAAADINFHLTEAITLGAGPMWSTNFAGSGGTVPVASVSELGGAFRLLFDLPERERKAP